MLSPGDFRSAGSARAGFTLIELMLVVAILAILAAVAVVTLTGYQRRARAAEIERFAAAVATAQEQVRPYTGYVSAGLCPSPSPSGQAKAFTDGCTAANLSAWNSLGVNLPNQTWHSYGLISWEPPASCAQPGHGAMDDIEVCNLPGGGDPSGWVLFAFGDQRGNGVDAVWATTHRMQGAFAQSRPFD